MFALKRASGRIVPVRFATGFLALAAVLSPFAAAAQTAGAGSIAIERPWSRATPPGAATGAGYLKLSNGGATDDRLVSASSTAANETQIHEMKVENGIMTMREFGEGLVIPAGGDVVLKPGGFHIMLIGLKAPLKAGDGVPVTLVFAKAGKVDVTLRVERLGAAGPGNGMGGEHAGHGMGEMAR